MRVCNNLIIICVCNICIVNLFWDEMTWERYVYVCFKKTMNEPLDQPNAVWINFFCFGKKEYLSYDCVLFIFQNESQKLNKRQLLTVDLLARASMKNAASCDT